jgi:predicted CXXCH cytochrome family protein
VLARIDGSEATYLAVDAPVLGASQFQTFRVRFQVRNNGTAPITATPQLEYRPDGAAGFAAVPDQPQPGIALHVAREWVPSVGLGGGTEQGPLGEDIAAVDLMTSSAVGVAVVGHHSMGANPDTPITLPAASYTEEEFTVRLTTDAKYLSGYELRITTGGAEMTGTQVARIVLGSPPAMKLSPGQRQGVSVDEPMAANAAGVVYPLLSAPPKTAAASTTMTAVPAVSSPSTAAFPLAAGFLSAATATPVTVAVAGPAAAGSTDSHGIVSGQCSACHRGHVAKAPNLTKDSEQSTLCFSCHDGQGSSKNVKSQYALTRPANNPAAREYYSHEAVDTSTATPHTRSELDEFGGLSNRHSECADCHNSHKAGGTDSVSTPDGWDASGRLAGVSGVSVVNGAAGTAPTYTFLDGVPKADLGVYPVTREYQLCFKCHSGFTTLTSNTGLKPSQYALDKGVEFNPANPSFHPVEAAGKNTTPKMDESLAGTSPYKLWNFTSGSTIRCLNCHASGTPAATPPPAAGASLAPHTSSNRGILLENYKDRVLTTASAAYSAGDFALCFVCHAEEPFRNETANKTNFSLHGRHLTGLEGLGSGGTDIDKAGDGQGNAICAECHFRIHSTTNKVEPQTVDGSRLVNFAPNVKPKSATIPVTWTKGATGGGSCSLTCHGYSHTRSYP